MLLPVCVTAHPAIHVMVKIMLCMCSGNVLLDILFSFKNKYQYTYLNTYILPPACPTFYVLYGMTKKGCVKVGLPVKGVISGSVGS